MATSSTRRQNALIEIEQLRLERHKDILTCVVSLITIIAIIVCKVMLVSSGVISSENMMADAVVMFASIGLAILSGSSSIRFTKAGRRIAYLRQSAGLNDKNEERR